MKVAEDLLLPRADLWATYTQRSMWQVGTRPTRPRFRSTDYQPELKYVVPVPDGLSVLPGGWSWRMLEAGFAHQSNGQSEPLSRSWNRLYAGTAFEKGELAVQVRVNRRPREGSKDDNPDLTRYIGNTEIQSLVAAGAVHRQPHLAPAPQGDEARLGAAGLDLSGGQPAAAGPALVPAAVQRLWRIAAGLQPPPDQPGLGLTLFQF